jgi:hypothetical protein
MVPDDWKKLDPVTMAEIEADGKRGDFMAIVTRRDLDDDVTGVSDVTLFFSVGLYYSIPQS